MGWAARMGSVDLARRLSGGRPPDDVVLTFKSSRGCTIYYSISDRFMIFHGLAEINV